MGKDKALEALVDSMRQFSGDRTPLAALNGFSNGLNGAMAGGTGLVQNAVNSEFGQVGHRTRVELHDEWILLGVMKEKLSMMTVVGALGGRGTTQMGAPLIETFWLDDIIDYIEVDGIRGRSKLDNRPSGGLLGIAAGEAPDRPEHSVTLQTIRGDCHIFSRDLEGRRKFHVALVTHIDAHEGVDSTQAVAYQQTVPPPPPPRAAPRSMPAGWMVDPSGRHELRYWDGSLFTEHVSNAGVAMIDPMTS